MKLYQFIKPHTHAGKEYKPDDEVVLNDHDAHLLVQWRVVLLKSNSPSAEQIANANYLASYRKKSCCI